MYSDEQYGGSGGGGGGGGYYGGQGYYYDPNAVPVGQGGGYGGQGSADGGWGGYGGAPEMVMGGVPLNPLVTDMARQYGDALVGQGRTLVDQKIARWVSVSKLKYYFAVDTAYVLKKMGLLFFPFTHKVSRVHSVD
jgi:hypothetical protein